MERFPVYSGPSSAIFPDSSWPGIRDVVSSSSGQLSSSPVTLAALTWTRISAPVSVGFGMFILRVILGDWFSPMIWNAFMFFVRALPELRLLLGSKVLKRSNERQVL